MSISEMIERPRSGKIALNGPTMGTRWSAVIRSHEAVDLPQLQSALSEVCHRVDSQMSTWKPNSDLMQLNRAKVNTWISIPDELAYVMALGDGVRERSGGLFDMAVLGDVQAAGFGPISSDIMTAASASAGPAVEIDMTGSRARRLSQRTLDLSGIAKGFAVDLMARTMEQLGLEDYLVAIDGELQAGGFDPDGRPWTVALEAPVADRREIAARLNVHNTSLATSGSYRHRRHVEGHWISHTIDPRTGMPAETDLVSVTVQMPDCVLADAWATALMVAGRDQAETICERLGLSAIMATPVGGEVQWLQTGQFDG